jgi:DNA mismatch endonuclease, patch repair protein
MSGIRSRRNRSTELKLIGIFRSHGITGWRCGIPLLGKPDFIFPRYRLAIFVDGCFWHGCIVHRAKPKRNFKYWETKAARNRKRDRFVNAELKRRGWKVIRIWEHSLKQEHRVLEKIRTAVKIMP